MNGWIRVIACGAFSITIAAGAAAQAPGKADALIDAAKAASGGAAWDKVITWHETGTVAAGGLSGRYETWLDLTSLHNSSEFSLGPSTGSNGWDGQRAWTTDSSKEVRVETSKETLAQAIQDAYRTGYGFYFPQRFPAKREYAGTRTADGKSYEAVKLTPQGAEPFEVWFDPTTHRIAREVQLTGAMPHTFIVSDFAPFGALQVPKKTIDRVGHDPKFDTVTEVTGLSFVGPQSLARYAPPPPPPNNAQWPPGKDSVTVPFRLLNNHIYVQASIDGQPVPFVFDTGATDILEESAARRLGIPVQGALPGGGFGDQIASFGFAKVKSVSLGGLTLPDQVFGTVGSAGWIAVEGADSAGLLGYEFAKRAVLSIDYARRTLTFTRQEAFHAPQDVAAIPFTFDSHIPMVSASLDGHTGEFQIDTGSRGALIVMHPFAAANHLMDRYHATRLVTMGYGVGGPSKALLARAGELTIAGTTTIKGPITELINDSSGAAAAAHTAGNIGGDLLKRYTVTLDYAHQLLWLQPNELAAEREIFDRAGVWIARAKDGAIEVADVAADSAAAKAGLVGGDEILAVNGKSARDVQLYDLREQFKGPVGTPFKLRLKGKQGEREVTLTLADQI
jgi:hypothetical protein